MSSNIKFTVFTKPWKLHLADLARLVRAWASPHRIARRPGMRSSPGNKDLPKAVKVFADEG